MTAKELYLQMSALLSDQPLLSKQQKSIMNDYLTVALGKYINNYINSRPR